MARTRHLTPLHHAIGAVALAASALVLAPACGDSESDGDAGSAGSAASDAGSDPDGTTDGSDDGSSSDGLPLVDVNQPDGDTGDPICGGQTVVGDPIVTNLLVVIDRSGSMKQTPTGFVDNKWDTMVGSLKTALEGIQGEMNIGLLFFPDASVASVSGCGMSEGDDVLISIDEGTVTVPLIASELDKAANDPDGNTPTADALALAHRYFTVGPGSSLTGEKYVLLALDGGPNCNPDITCAAASCTTNIDRSVLDPTASACPIDPASCCDSAPEACLDDTATTAQVSALSNEGIPTFVVGIPGSDLYANVLDSLAVAGGVPASTTSPKYFEVSDPDALTQTLIEITRALVKTCEFQLAETPPDPDKVNVYVDGEVLPQDGPDGWHYDNSTTPPTIVITGATCDELETTGAESVTFEFGCPTITVK
ncbi:MAG: hypothetical protein CVU63_06720 [Deltaproteobacteria bacterium HGW-Deltaproteobacteria-20]|nr:MAG: hypothetical protein CVU63_06720 [Deltaproteobacteria bacterium HGW-Deltaproteobacteria-20]